MLHLLLELRLSYQSKGLAVESYDSCFVYATYTDAGIGGYKTQLSQGLWDFWVIKFCDSTLTTSVNNKLSTNSNIIISPNPVTKKIKFFLEKSANVKISNLLGVILYNKTLIKDVELDVSTFTNGIYLIQIDDEVKKFVKE